MDPGTMLAIASVLGPALQGILGGGQGDNISRLPTKTKGQRGQLNTAINQWQDLAGGGYENAIGVLQSLLDPNSEAYQNFSAPYLQQYQQQILPGIAEQFAGAGALESSGFGQALGAAGANLQTNLAQLREQLRMQGAGGLLEQYNKMFGQTQGQSPFMYTRESGGQGFGQSALNSLSQAGGNYLSNQVGASDKGRGYATQNPLTNTYDQLFRTGAMT